jgi:hypothetical protein
MSSMLVTPPEAITGMPPASASHASPMFTPCIMPSRSMSV